MNTNKKLHLGFLLFQKYGLSNTYFTRDNIIKYKFSHLPFFTLEPFGELHKCIAFFFSAKKYFHEGKIIIFIERKVDVLVLPNLQNITNYTNQNIIAFIQIVEVAMEN